MRRRVMEGEAPTLVMKAREIERPSAVSTLYVAVTGIPGHEPTTCGSRDQASQGDRRTLPPVEPTSVDTWRH